MAQRAGDREVGHVVAGPGGQRALLTPAGHPAVDQPRVALQAHVGTEAQALHDAGPEALQSQVGPVDQAQRGLRPSGRLRSSVTLARPRLVGVLGRVADGRTRRDGDSSRMPSAPRSASTMRRRAAARCRRTRRTDAAQRPGAGSVPAWLRHGRRPGCARRRWRPRRPSRGTRSRRRSGPAAPSVLRRRPAGPARLAGVSMTLGRTALTRTRSSRYSTASASTRPSRASLERDVAGRTGERLQRRPAAHADHRAAAGRDQVRQGGRGDQVGRAQVEPELGLELGDRGLVHPAARGEAAHQVDHRPQRCRRVGRGDRDRPGHGRRDR